MNKRKLIDYTETSHLLGVKLSTLYTWVHRRQIPHVRLSKRGVKFDLDEIQGWIESNRVAPEQPVMEARIQ